MPTKSNALFSLIRNKKSDDPAYGVTISLTPKHDTKSGLTTPYQFFQEVEQTRAFVIGHSDGAVLGHTLPHLLARHLVILTYPIENKIFIRLLALHPNLEFETINPIHLNKSDQPKKIGGVETTGALHICTDSFELEIEVRFLDGFSIRPTESEETRFFSSGEQIDFNDEEEVTFIGTLVDSITGPGTGGHAIPALSQEEDAIQPGSHRLALRSSKGLQSITIEDSMLEKGILIGRSRRCKLGRKYSDQDGLSRIHALVIGLQNKIYAIDLASKYGLRDVTKPNIKLHTAPIDNQIGCLVYGAGHLVVEKD